MEDKEQGGLTMGASVRNRKGVFLTIDVAVSLLLMLTLLSIAAYYFGQPQNGAFSSAVLRNYVHDAAGIMDAKGYFAQPLMSG